MYILKDILTSLQIIFFWKFKNSIYCVIMFNVSLHD